MPSATISRCPRVAQVATSLVTNVTSESWLFVRRMPMSLTEACFRTNVGQSGQSLFDMRGGTGCQCACAPLAPVLQAAMESKSGKFRVIRGMFHSIRPLTGRKLASAGRPPCSAGLADRAAPPYTLPPFFSKTR